MNPEVFYLHVHGEQRGPYTIRQIDHQLNAGLISEETTYWREGMEQWQPVTYLVTLRNRPKKKRWVLRGLLVGALLVVALLGRFLGPIVLVGWRETAQYDFTPRAAYWRARDIVRHEGLPAGVVISFSPLAEATTELREEPPGARVRLHSDSVGRRQEWEVALQYDRRRREWSGQLVPAPR